MNTLYGVYYSLVPTYRNVIKYAFDIIGFTSMLYLKHAKDICLPN